MTKALHPEELISQKAEFGRVLLNRRITHSILDTYFEFGNYRETC